MGFIVVCCVGALSVCSATGDLFPRWVARLPVDRERGGLDNTYTVFLQDNTARDRALSAKQTPSPTWRSTSSPISVSSFQKISNSEGGLDGGLGAVTLFGHDVTEIGDLDGDGNNDLAVGTWKGRVMILFLNADGTVKSKASISKPWLFGAVVGALGDLDGDGVPDLAVSNYRNMGAIWILFLNTDATVKAEQVITNHQGGFGDGLSSQDEFGRGVSSIGDLDGDGVIDVAAGAWHDDDGGKHRGAVWIMFMNVDGTVKAKQKISSVHGGFSGTLKNEDWFGSSVAGIGDLDGDGVLDLAVGAVGDDDGGYQHGAAWILFMNTDGTVKTHQKISSLHGGFTGRLLVEDFWGASVSGLGDIDGDGIRDVVVGARRRERGGPPYGRYGMVWLLFLNADGTVKQEQKISKSDISALNVDDLFGLSVARLNDRNGDGLPELAVGAITDADGAFAAGAVYIIFLERDLDGDGIPDLGSAI